MAYYMGGANPMKQAERELTLSDIICLLILIVFLVIPLLLLLYMPPFIIGKLTYPAFPYIRPPRFTIGGVLAGACITCLIGQGIVHPEVAHIVIPCALISWCFLSTLDTIEDIRNGKIPPHILRKRIRTQNSGAQGLSDFMEQHDWTADKMCDVYDYLHHHPNWADKAPYSHSDLLAAAKEMDQDSYGADRAV